MKKWVFVCGLLALVLGAFHCGGKGICGAGATQSCVCFDGRSGAQVCADDGARWEVCRCDGSHDAGSQRDGTPGSLCKVGVTQPCTCFDGRSGTQVCADDQTRWEVCRCATSEASPPEPPDTASDASHPEPPKPEQPTEPHDPPPEHPPTDAHEQTHTPDAPPHEQGADGNDTPPPGDGTPQSHDPVLLIHGVNGSLNDFKLIIQRLTQDGWPASMLFAYTFKDPKWGCNVDNAATIKGWVTDILQTTGRTRIDLVAHSMGTLSSRHYIKNLGGAAFVNTYVTLGGMHHGLSSSCSPDFPFKPCIWKEICSSGSFVKQLNDAPATPGKLRWVSIYGSKDTTVPNSSSILQGAENIEIKGATHDGTDGVQSHPDAYNQLKRVLQYPAWQ